MDFGFIRLLARVSGHHRFMYDEFTDIQLICWRACSGEYRRDKPGRFQLCHVDSLKDIRGEYSESEQLVLGRAGGCQGSGKPSYRARLKRGHRAGRFDLMRS